MRRSITAVALTLIASLALPAGAQKLLQQASQKFDAADKALKAGDLQGYAKAQQQARALVQQALDAADKAAAKQPKKKPSSSPSSKSSTKPSSSASSTPS